jgi:hypothetical protein
VGDERLRDIMEESGIEPIRRKEISMRGARRVHVLIPILFAMIVGAAGQENAEAVPPVTWKQLQVHSALPGNYCGGESRDVRGLSLDLTAECKTLYGASATAATVKQDAYGWACKVPGQPDKGLNMQAACQRRYGSTAIATLVGIGIYDWRCLRPADVGGHVAPVLLFPVEKLNVNEVSFVAAALGRLDALMGGIRRFYRARTGATVPGTNTFVLPTGTSARDWQNLALCTDQAVCQSKGNPVPFDRYGFHKRVKQELANGRWNVLVAKSSVRIGGFVTLGSSFPETPTWLGAAAEGVYFSQPPSNSYASCSTSANNPPAYENAFYGAGHEFGHTMGLPHTDQYNVTKPPNWQQSIMYTGNGTASAFFPFEADRLRPFLTNWR